jgi:hypothetical protein
MAIKTKVALCAVMILGTVSSALAAKAPYGPVNVPYGTPAQQQQCVANMEASLHGQSILGSRDTPEYIQDLGQLHSNGFSEYDVMVGRCMDKFYHQYTKIHGNKPTYGGSYGG